LAFVLPSFLLIILFHINFFKMNIFVAKLNFDTQSEDVQRAFEAFGAVDSAKVIMDRETGRSRGFAFVEMPNDDEAQSAIDALNETELDGSTIVVKKAEPRPQKPRGFGGGDRGGFGGGDRGGYNRGGDRGDRGGFSRGGDRGDRGGFNRDRNDRFGNSGFDSDYGRR
jgi:RNA recognition motif-containing protein